MVLLVEISIVFVCLSVEHVVKMPAFIHLQWFARHLQFLKYKAQGPESLIEPEEVVSSSLLNWCGTNFSFSGICCLHACCW